MKALSARHQARALWLGDSIELTKPRITLMVVITTAVGMVMAASTVAVAVSPLLVAATLGGTWLLAAGASALNMWWERDADARMRRTERRPLPAGRLEPEVALTLGLGLSVAGTAVLLVLVNTPTAVLGTFTLASYVALYTPLKRTTEWSTLIGAVPGAIPPMMGWAAVTGRLDALAWTLFSILFLWQVPHFYAIAWLYRDDYAAGSFRTLAVVDPLGRRSARQSVVFTVLLVIASLVTVGLGISSVVYGVGALALGFGFLRASLAFARLRTAPAARRLMLYSVVYLPVLLGLLVIDRLLF
ncbi:MAG TPA: heme o synthase [Thermoanaerobaculia bacterium]|nr:heme o synthase [Thermoanaerobaculia bacterium]